jgi:hypothetical protein
MNRKVNEKNEAFPKKQKELKKQKTNKKGASGRDAPHRSLPQSLYLHIPT